MNVTKEWYRARCFLLGENEESYNLDRFLELASRCDHPDAVLLSSVLKKGMKPTEVVNALKKDGGPVGRVYVRDMGQKVVGSVDMKHPLYHFYRFAHLSVDLHDSALDLDEPRALYNASDVTAIDEQLCLYWLKRAADMGHRAAMREYAERMYRVDDVRRYQWIEQSEPRSYVYVLTDQVHAYLKKTRASAAKYYIGKILHDMNAGLKNNRGAVRYYRTCNQNAYRATLAWMACARCLQVCKDVARMIGTLVHRSHTHGLSLVQKE